MNSTVYIYVNNRACYGPRYICKCKRHDNVRYECITNGLFGTLATERICSAVQLNCMKARIEPLFELNRNAYFFNPIHTKKNSCRMLEGEKNNLQAHTRKKNFILNQGVKKNFTTRPNHPPPPPPQKSNGRPLRNIYALLTEREVK